MNCEIKNCKVKETLERVRYQLEEAITSNFSNLLIADVISLSQSMDKMVSRCMQCKTANSIIDILDITNIKGRHSMFFYYGREHLLVCLANYLKIGIEKNEFCPVFLQPDWYESLFDYFDSINLPKKNIKHYPVNEMLGSFMEGGTAAFNFKAVELSKWAINEGFSGVRMIGQCSYAIKLSCKSDFLAFEQAINDAFRETMVGGLCVYDFNDFIHSNTYIDDDVLMDSFKTHTNVHFISSCG